MTPYRRIVVGTDGSDSARRAVEQAAWLARRLGSELVISHAYQDLPEERGAARQVGASLLRDACADLPVTPTPDLREGDAAEALLALGAEEGPNLVVVGNRGLGRRRVVLGNVPGKVAHRASTDVLVAHTTGPADPRYERMILATDGSPTAARALIAGRSLAEAIGMEASELRVTEGDPGAGIVDAARKRDADVIVVGNRGMMGARRFVASVPSKVLRQAPCHVLLVKTT